MILTRSAATYATAYDACTEIANFTVKKRNTRVALRGLSHVACLLIMFLTGVWRCLVQT